MSPRPKEQFQHYRLLRSVRVLRRRSASTAMNCLKRRTDGAGGGTPGPGVPRQAYIRHGRDQTESIVGLSMTADGAITARDNILEHREAHNRTLEQEFERYLTLHPIADSYERENAQRLFEAYATDEATRRAIDSGEYSTLGNAITIRQYGLVPPEHRQAIPEYVRNLNSQAA